VTREITITFSDRHFQSISHSSSRAASSHPLHSVNTPTRRAKSRNFRLSATPSTSTEPTSSNHSHSNQNPSSPLSVKAAEFKRVSARKSALSTPRKLLVTRSTFGTYSNEISASLRSEKRTTIPSNTVTFPTRFGKRELDEIRRERSQRRNKRTREESYEFPEGQPKRKKTRTDSPSCRPTPPTHCSPSPQHL
jgi:hypothetical protein